MGYCESLLHNEDLWIFERTKSKNDENEKDIR